MKCRLRAPLRRQINQQCCDQMPLACLVCYFNLSRPWHLPQPWHSVWGPLFPLQEAPYHLPSLLLSLSVLSSRSTSVRLQSIFHPRAATSLTSAAVLVLRQVG